MTANATRAGSPSVEGVHWYHTLALPDGTVTPGWFDTRGAVSRMPWPGDGSLHGLRCLDVGTWDGFWAFEMERRGASEVVAIDLDDPARWDWPPTGRPVARDVLETVKSGNQAFSVARSALGSSVDRRDLSVYDLSVEAVGRFDLAFVGSLLLHLRDPVAALVGVRSVASRVIVADTVEAIPSLLRPRTPVARLEGLHRPWWWQPNVAGVRRLVQSAGWEIEARTGLYFVPTGSGPSAAPVARHRREVLTAAGRESLIVRLVGVPHTAVRAVAPLD